MPEDLEHLLRMLFEYAYGENLSGTPFPASMSSRLPEIAKSVTRLSQLYTRERNRLPDGVLNHKELRQAYLTYFLPSNLFKLKGILGEIWRHPMRQEFLSPNLRVLDLGSGPATYSLGFLDLALDAGPSFHSLEFVAVDRLAANLRDAQSIFSRHLAYLRNSGLSVPCRLWTEEADLTRLPDLNLDQTFDFVILGNVINELFVNDGDRLKRCCSLVASVASRWLAARGFLILLEPALKETSRDLLQLRDQLLISTDLKVYSPCVHNFPCPALCSGNGSDWCHEDRAWSSHDILRRIDALTGNRKDSLKFSYVVFSRMGISIKDTVTPTVKLLPGDEAKLSEEQHRPEIWRAVSEHLKEKGKSSAFLCGSPGRWRVTRLDKHASSDNQAFRTLQRGQLVMTMNLKRRSPTEMRVEPDTQVIRVLDPPVEVVKP
jgi:ribosomal protein RSM22 (predicted rRNA methylase)